MNDIERFLRENRPETPDEGQFIVELNARLSAVEGIRKTVEGERRRWRMAPVVALLSGLALGALVALFLALHPILPHLLRPPQALLDNRDYILVGIAALALTLGVVFVGRRREAL